MAPSDRDPLRPQPVRVESVSSDVMAQFQGIGTQAGTHGQTMDPSAQFRSILTDTGSISASIREITQALTVATDMAKQFQTMMTSQAEAVRAAQSHQTDQLKSVVQAIQDALSGATKNPRAQRGDPKKPAPSAGPNDSVDPIDLDALFGGNSGGPQDRRRSRHRSSGGRHRADPSMQPHDPQEDLASRTQLSDHAQQDGRGQPIYKSSLHRRIGNVIHNRYGTGTGGNTGPVARVASRIAGGVASRGVGGALDAGMDMIPGAGEVLIAGGIVNEGLKTITNQTKDNSQYQSIYGGSNWGTGLENRVAEQGFVWGNRMNAFSGGLNAEDAQAAFQGVSDLGQQGGTRDTSLGFIQSSYSKLGMSVQQSLQLVQLSAQGANSTLGGLSTALQGVGQMAAATGQNANVLYQAFAQNYAGALQSGGGANAAALAAGQTALGPGSSRDFASLTTPGVNTNFGQRLIAQNAGMPYDKLQAMNSLGNTGPYAAAVDKTLGGSAINSLNSLGNQNNDLINQLIAQNGGSANVLANNGALSNVAVQTMAQSNNIDIGNMRNELQATGMVDTGTMSDQAVLEYAIKYKLNPNQYQDSVKANTAKFGQSKLGANGSSDSAFNQHGHGLLDLTSVQGSKFVQDNYQTDLESNLGIGGGANLNTNLKAYTQYQQTTGNTDPVIQSLIKQVGSDSNTGIQVQTADGAKVVSLQDAIQYYPDQLAKGTATIQGGDPANSGKSVQDLVGGTETNYSGADTIKSENHGGVDAAQWNKDHPTPASQAAGAGGGTVTVGLTSQAQQLLQLVGTTGSVKQQAAAGAGLPALPGGGLPNQP
jgi:hypothetical protein